VTRFNQKRSGGDGFYILALHRQLPHADLAIADEFIAGAPAARWFADSLRFLDSRVLVDLFGTTIATGPQSNALVARS